MKHQNDVKALRVFRLSLISFLLILSLLPLMIFADSGASGGKKNLIANGGFQQVDASGFPAQWKFGDPQFCVIVHEHDQQFLRISLASEGAAITSQTIPVDSNWGKVKLNVKIRAKNLKPGDQPWKTARVQALFADAKGEHVGGWNALNLPADQDWKEMSDAFDVPDGASRLEIACGVWGASGTVDFDDVSVTASLKQLPPGERPDWSGDKVLNQTATRSRINLSGDWLFKPAVNESAEKPVGNWGVSAVPGSIPAPADRMWYERDVLIPAEWAEREVELELQRVSTDAKIWVNEAPAGEIRWPGGVLPISQHLVAGKKNTIRILVVAVDDRKEVEVRMGYTKNDRVQAELNTRGLIGAVCLQSRPKNRFVSDVFIRPSVRKKQIAVDCQVVGNGQAGPVTMKMEISALDGANVASLSKLVEASSRQDQTVSADFPLPSEIKLWDVGQPNLYSVVVTVESPSFPADSFHVSPFGFREFWIDGRDFYLNGSKIYLRPSLLAAEWASTSGNAAASVLAAGCNFGEIWPSDHSRRGSDHRDDDLIAQADTAGLLISGNALSLGDFIKKETWSDPAMRAEYQRQLELELRRWRNHPSIVMWGTSGNVFQSQADGEPRLFGRRNFSCIQEYSDQAKRGEAAIAVIKSLDPTRPVFTHFGAYVGDVYTSNLYLNFTPLQEREEWLSAWSQKGEMPFMAVEFGTPFWSSWTRGRNGFPHSGNAEVFLSEWAAVYLGSEAYRMEPPAFRKLLAERFKGGNLQSEYEPVWWWGNQNKLFIDSEAFQKVQDLFITNTWRSWRAMGVTGGMIPWDNGTDSKALPKVNGETLVWIAGPPGATNESQPAAPAVTEKTHHFEFGQKLQKQAVLLNDSRSTKDYQLDWRVQINGDVIARKQQAGKLAAGEHLFVPIEVSIPTSSSVLDAQGSINVDATIGDSKHSDEFSFRVYAKEPQSQGELTVFDPKGDTTKLLRDLGYSVNEWKSGVPAAGSVVVVGRNALSGNGRIGQHDLPAVITDFVKDGGRVLVFEQDPHWTRFAWQLRVANQVSRRAFIVPTLSSTSITEKIDSEDLRDWSGAGSAVDGYRFFPGYESTLRYGWRWGNRGSVSSSMIEKPHRSSWRPILEGEFDLAYSPLMEMEFGRGRVTLCTLDLESRSGETDPVARRLARRIVEHARLSPIVPKASKVFYAGEDADAQLLSDLGVEFDRGYPTTEAQESSLLIAGGGADQQKLRAYVQDGGRLAVLHQETPKGLLDSSLKQVADFHGAVEIDSWPESAGLGISDLHLRSDTNMWLLQSSEGVISTAGGMLGHKSIGKGSATFIQFSPKAIPADEKRYFRFSRWRQTRALCQVLSNMGATFHQDRRFLELLAQPDHSWHLAGQWDVQLTERRDESPDRVWNPDPGVSKRALKLIEGENNDEWESVSVPAYLESYGPQGSKWRWADGECVFRSMIQDVPKRLAGRETVLALGRVDETESSYLNGKLIGTSKSWVMPRAHRIAAGLLAGGRNTIMVRTWDEGIHGGMCGDPDDLYLRVSAKDAGFYHPDYLSDDLDPDAADEKAWVHVQDRRQIADNPYRYYRW